ncbi:hypothetical protein GOV05_02760 [Candidatus Woesearchaeota archaeon]|nr:hypothetical protein [Candidatus Woesearchaeota archaeon]
MDKVLSSLGRAQRKIKTADYMLTMTYETLKEPKLLLTISTTVFDASKNALDAALAYERYFKRIPAYNENSFEAKLSVFKQRLVEKYGVSTKELEYLNFLRNVSIEHQKSAVEFTRKEKFFIFDNDYRGEKISKDDVKNAILKAKIFIEKIYQVIKNKK